MPLPISEPNDEEKQEKLSGDDGTPFSLPVRKRVNINDGRQRLSRPELDSTHPITDTDIEVEEIYDEGLAAAAGVSEPNADDAVISYTPPKKPKNSTPKTK